jgi:hypothetical protein
MVVYEINLALDGDDFSVMQVYQVRVLDNFSESVTIKFALGE